MPFLKPTRRDLSRRDLFRGAAAASAGLAVTQFGAGAAGARGASHQAGEQRGSGAYYSMWYLEYANAPRFAVSGLLYGAHNQGTIKIPFGYVVIKGMNTLAVFDTGFRTEGRGGELANLFGVVDWESPDTVLGKIGLSPNDVEHAIIGHAHFDHADNIPGFPNAHVYIQEREISAWMNAMQFPKELAWVTGAFNPQDIMDAVQRSASGRATLVSGEMEDVLPGISIYPAHDTHTFGSQYAEVTIGSGADTRTFVLSSDAIYTYANIEGGVYGMPPGVFIPIGYAQGNQVTQLQKMYEMVQRADGNTMQIIPGHDGDIFQRYPSKQVGPNRIAEIVLAPNEPSRL